MSTKSSPICGDHQTQKQWRPTTFEYEEDGVTVKVPNVYAWVCEEDGEASFTPETVDEIIGTVRELIASGKRAKQRRSVLTEYIVSVDKDAA